MGFNPNKTLTINPNKTLGITQTVITKVTATFSVDPLASPNTFPPQQVVANTEQVISPGSPVKDGFIFTGWLPSLPATISQNTTFVAQFETDTGTTPSPLQTLTPSTGTVGVTSNSVTFNITNNDPAPNADIVWAIRQGSDTGTIVASGTETVNSGQTVQVSATGLSSQVSYWLTGVRATAPTKTQSGEAAFRVLTTNPLPQTATPETAVSSVTTNSVTFRIRNLDANIASISWLIRQGTETGTIVNSGTNTNVGSNVDIFPSATGLSSGVVYWLTNITAQASGKTTSQPGINRSTTTGTTTTTTPAPTAAPFFSNISTTSNSIGFRANNDDSAAVTMLVTNQSTQNVLFNGTVSGNSFTTVNQSGLSPSTSYSFNINAQASGRPATDTTQTITTNALPQTATPTTGNFNNTSSSVAYILTNNDASTAAISWQIRQGTQTGSLVDSGTSNVNSGSSQIVSATGLSSSTTFWLVNVFATASGKTQSNEGTRRSLNTLATTTTTTTTTAAPTLQWVQVSGTTGTLLTYEAQQTVCPTQAAAGVWLESQLPASVQPVGAIRRVTTVKMLSGVQTCHTTRWEVQSV
jgi:hypothetical protein